MSNRRSEASYALATCKARELIRELQISTPEEIVVEKIAPYKGAAIRRTNLNGCDGRLLRQGTRGIISVDSSVTTIGHARFVIAHELGHFLLHPTIYQYDEVDIWQSRNFNHNQKKEELEANYFAAELLSPVGFISHEIAQDEPSWDVISDLARKYKTTLSSMAIQYTRCTNEPVIIAASENGRRKWFSFSKHARDFWLIESDTLHHFSCAYELCKSGKTRYRSSKVSAAAWLRGFSYDCTENLTEDAIRSKRSDFTLSLLWIHDEI